MITVHVKLKLPNEILEYLQCESNNRQISLGDVVSTVLIDYFDEPTHEKLLAGLRHSLEQVVAGEYRPACDFLDEIDSETG